MWAAAMTSVREQRPWSLKMSSYNETEKKNILIMKANQFCHMLSRSQSSFFNAKPNTYTSSAISWGVVTGSTVYLHSYQYL